MVDMIQDLNMMTDSTYNNGSDIIESSFSKSTSYQPMSIPKSYPNHKESSAQHFDSSGDHKLLVPVSSRISRRSIPLFIDCINGYSSIMTYECNDDDDVLSASHLSVVHAAGYEVTSVELQQMVNHICSSSPDQFVNHCLRERRHREAKSLEVCTNFSMTPNDDKAMMQSRRQVSDQMTMHHRNSYTTSPRSNLCLPCSDPNSVAFFQEIEPLPFRRWKKLCDNLSLRPVCNSTTMHWVDHTPKKSESILFMAEHIIRIKLIHFLFHCMNDVTWPTMSWLVFHLRNVFTRYIHIPQSSS